MAEEKLPDIIPLGGSNPIADEFETVFDPASGRTVVRRRSSRAGGAAGQGQQIVGKLDAIAQGVVRDWQGETKADLAGDFAKAFSLKQSLEQLAPLTPDEEQELGSLKSTPPRATYPSGPYMAPFNQGDLSLQRRTELERRKNAPSMIAQVDMDLQRLATEIQEVQAILDRNQGVTAGAKKFNEADGFWAKTKAFARSPLDVSATKAAESAYTGAKISALAAGVTAGTIASGGTLALGSGLGLATSGAMTANEGYDQTLLEELIKIDPSIVNDPKGFLEAYKKNPVDYRKAYDEAKSTALKSGLAQGAAETATAGLLKFIPTAKTAIGRAIADYAGEHAEEVSSLFGERAVQGQLPTGGELADTLFSTAAGTAAQKAVTSAGGYAIDKSGIKGAISEAMRPRLQVDLDTLIPLGQPGQEAQGAQPTAAPGIAPLQVTPGSIVPFEQGGQQAATPTNPTAQTELPDVIPLPATPTATAASASDQGLPTTPQAAQPQGQAQPQQTPAGLSPLSPIAQQAFPVGQPPRAPQAPQLTPTPAPAAQVPSPLAPQAAGAQGPRGGQGPQGPNPLAPQVAQTQAPQAQQAAGAQAPADVGSLFTPPAPAAPTQPTAQAQAGAPAGLPQPGAQIPQAGALPAPGAQAGAPMPGVQPQGQTPQGRQRGISLAPPQPTTAAAPTAAPRNLTPQEQTAWANLERKAAELDRRREARRQQQGRNTNPDTRNRGPEQIAMRLINELRSGGTLTLQEANGALRIVEKLMENGYLDNLAVSVSNAQRGAGVRGDYNPVKELVQLFVRNTNRPGVFKRTFAHEVSHHLERMVPAKDLEAARQQFLRERAKWLSDKKGIRALLGEGNWLDRSFTNEQIRDFLAKNQMDPALISKYFIRDTNTGRWRIKLTDETYRYTNFSEYFAEKVAQIAGDRDDNRANNQANPGVWAKIRGMLAQIKKAMIEVFGRDEVEAIWDKFQQGEYSAEFQRDELQGYDKTGGQNPVQDNLTTADYRTPRVGPADAGRQGRVENIDKLEPNRALSARDKSTNIPAEREQEAMSIAASIFSGNTEALASADPELVARVKELVQEGKDRAAIKYKQGARVKSDTKWRIGKRLSEENASRGMGVLDMKTVEGRIAMASAIAAEVEHHQSEGKTDINKDWYAESVARTKRIANKLLNGALDDPGNETAFLLIFSLTSNGQTIEANTEIGTHLTRKFLETGKFSNDFVGGGARRPQIIAALQLADRVFNALGKDKAKMREFLNTKFNPDDVYAELEKLGFTSTPQGKKRWWNWKLTVAREVGSAYGSAIFGPKLGGEFYQNMRGNKDATTKDTWFSRAFYRIKGDLTAVNSDTIVKNIERLIAGAQAEGYAIPNAVLADANRTMKAIRSGKFDPNSPVNPEGPLMRFASERLKAYTKSVDPVTKKGFADKTEVNLASKSIVENSRSFKEAPDAGDRSVMDDVSAMAREMLKAKGIDIASDALQAEWWGSEKALYDHLGQDGALNQNETFDLAMEKLYRDTTGNEYQDDAGPAGKGPQRAVARDGGSAGQGIAKPDAKGSRGPREGSGEGVAQSARDDGENTPIPGGYREAFFQAKKGAGAPEPKQIRWWTEVGHDTSGDISNQFLWAIDAKGEMKIISVEDLHEMLGGTPFDSEDSNGQTPSHLDWADDERSEPGLLKGPAHGRIDATGDVVRISMVQKGQNDAAMKADMRDYVKGKLSEIMGVEPNQARGYDFTDASPFKDPEVFSARDEEGPSIPKPSRAGSFKAFDEMVTGREIPKPEGMPYPYNLKRFTTLAPASQTARKNLAGYHLVQQGSDLGPQGKDEAREFRVVSKELMPVSDSPVHEYRIRFRFEPRGPGSAAGAVTVLFTDEGGMNNSTPEHVKIGLISELFERARQAGITDIFVSRDYAGEIDEKELGLFGHVAKTEPEISFGRYSDEDGYNGYKIDKKTAYSARDEEPDARKFVPVEKLFNEEPATAESLYSPTAKKNLPAGATMEFGPLNEPYGADRSYGEWENGVKEKGASAHKIYVRDSEGNVIAEANVIADTSHVFTKRPKYLDGKIQRKAPKLEEGWAMTVEMIAGDSARAQVAIAAEAVERAKMAGATMVIVPFKGWDHREAVGQLIAKLEDTEEVKIDDEIDALNVVFKQNTPDYASAEDGDAAYGIRRDQVYSARDEDGENTVIPGGKREEFLKKKPATRPQYYTEIGHDPANAENSYLFMVDSDGVMYVKRVSDLKKQITENYALNDETGVYDVPGKTYGMDINYLTHNDWEDVDNQFENGIIKQGSRDAIAFGRIEVKDGKPYIAVGGQGDVGSEIALNDGRKEFRSIIRDAAQSVIDSGEINNVTQRAVGLDYSFVDGGDSGKPAAFSRRDEDTPVAGSRAGRAGLVAGAMALAPTTVQAATGAAKAGATIAGVAAGDLIGLATGIALTSTDRPLRGLNPIAANMHLLANDTKSPTMARIANMFGLLGGNTSAGAQETYHDSRDSSRRIFRNKLAAAFDPLAKLSQDQIRALDVTIARALAGEIPMPSGAVGQVVQNLRALSDELYNHLREAGVDVNYAQDYAIPHSFNAEAVAKDEQAFIDKAEQAYIRNNPERIRTLTGYIAQIAAEAKASGWTSEMRDRSAALQAEIDKLRNANPRQQAEDLAAAILSGEEGGDQSQGLILGSNPQNQNKADFLKSRVFESAARAMLREYFHNDARHAWNNYIARATTISEFTRRFGKDGEKWNKLVEQLRAEKVSNEDITRIKELVLDAMGALTPAARGGHAMANALLGLSNMSKLKSTFLTNFLEAQAQAIPGGLLDTVTAPVVMLKEFAAVLAELTPRQRALLKRLIRIDLNTETGNMELARIVGLMDASGVHQIMENSAYNLDRSSDFREDSRTDRTARGVSNVTSGLARAYGIEASENAKRAMGARYASGRLDQYVSELIRDNIIARALAKVGYTKDTFTTKNEARMRLRRAGVADADMAAFTQWWEKARASGKFNEMLADSTDPMAAKARRAIRMESSRAMVNSNRAMKPGGERNKAISQDNFWGKAVMSFLNYPAAFREQVAKPMARDIRSGVRGFESEGGESTFFSPAERARMIAKVAAIPAMAVSAAAFLALRTMVNGDDEDKEELQQKGLFSQLIDGLSYTGFLGGKTEAVQRARRGQLPPIVDEGVRLGKNLERESTKSNGKERAVTKSVTRSIGVPALQVAATTALPMPLATVIDQALASKAFTETVVDIVAGPGKAKSTGGSTGSGRESGRESGRSGSRSDGR